jgi:hypothetical protein
MAPRKKEVIYRVIGQEAKTLIGAGGVHAARAGSVTLREH